MMTLEQIVKRARDLSLILIDHSDVSCSQTISCLESESVRPLTKEEKGLGWSQRPYWAYLTSNMCNGCRAFWFADRAAQTLEEITAIAARMKCREVSRV